MRWNCGLGVVAGGRRFRETEAGKENEVVLKNLELVFWCESRSGFVRLLPKY
jgi:hypothetical protein